MARRKRPPAAFHRDRTLDRGQAESWRSRRDTANREATVQRKLARMARASGDIDSAESHDALAETAESQSAGYQRLLARFGAAP